MATISNVQPWSQSTTDNAKKKGLGSNLSIGSSGLVQSASTKPITKAAERMPTTSTAKTSGLVPSGMGAYKGVQIRPGTDEEIQQQIRDIDNPVSQIKDIPAPNTGLFKDVKQSISPQVVDKPATFSSLVGGLADAAKPSANQQSLNQSLVGASRPTSTQTGLVGDLRSTARGNFDIGEEAQRISNQYAPEIARIGGLGAAAQAGYGSSGTNVVGAGNAAIASQSASQRMQALAAGQDAALKGTAQQLTAQGQAANAFDSALGGANTQQLQQLSGLGTALGSANTQQAQAISGLGTAAGLAAPSGTYPFVFDPLTQGFTNAGGGGVLTPQQAAQDVISGKTTYDQAKQALGYLGGTGEAQLQSAVTSLGGNPLTLQAQGATQQGIIGDQTAQVAAYTSAHQQAMNLQTQLADLITTFGINPSDVNVVNAGLQKIAKNTSSAEYKILENYLVDVASRYAQILTPSGGSQTDTTRATASSMLDGIAGGNSIIAVMNALDQQAKAVIQGVPTTGSSSPFTSSPQQGGSGGLYDF